VVCVLGECLPLRARIQPRPTHTQALMRSAALPLTCSGLSKSNCSSIIMWHGWILNIAAYRFYYHLQVYVPSTCICACEGRDRRVRDRVNTSETEIKRKMQIEGGWREKEREIERGTESVKRERKRNRDNKNERDRVCVYEKENLTQPGSSDPEHVYPYMDHASSPLDTANGRLTLLLLALGSLLPRPPVHRGRCVVVFPASSCRSSPAMPYQPAFLLVPLPLLLANVLHMCLPALPPVPCVLLVESWLFLSKCSLCRCAHQQSLTPVVRRCCSI
jgi:hypothetical protein